LRTSALPKPHNHYWPFFLKFDSVSLFEWKTGKQKDAFCAIRRKKWTKSLIYSDCLWWTWIARILLFTMLFFIDCRFRLGRYPWYIDILYPYLIRSRLSYTKHDHLDLIVAQSVCFAWGRWAGDDFKIQ
jgi:hypothetical protein